MGRFGGTLVTDGGSGKKPRFSGVPVSAAAAAMPQEQPKSGVSLFGDPAQFDRFQADVKRMGSNPGSELLSGINTGIANIMSLPAMIGNTALSVGPKLSNALLGTKFNDQPNAFPDPGKYAKELMDDTGMVKPPSSDPMLKGIRRIGEEVGGALPFAPLGPLSVLGSAVTAGTGAAVAQQAFPGNPWAELAGELLGGAAPGALRNTIERVAAGRAAPTAEELQTLKNAAYRQADQTGALYSEPAYQRLVGDTQAAAAADNISATRHPLAFSFIQDMRARGNGGMSLTELDQLRQEARRDLIRSTDESEQHFGRLVLRRIDDFIGSATGRDMVAGSATDADNAIVRARDLNTRFRKTELIEDALYNAHLRAASTGSGGNVNNAIRQEFRKILTGEDRQSFSPEEISEMERVVRQGTGDELLRLVGKLSPTGNGLMAALGIGATAANPLLAAVPLAGTAAKGISDAATIGKANRLRANVARGGRARVGNPRNAALVAAMIGSNIVGRETDDSGKRKTLINSLLAGSGR